MQVMERNNISVSGSGKTMIMFAHGLGCDQSMWRLVAPAFASDHKIVLMAHVGAGNSDLASYDAEKYSTLEGYALDVVEIGEAVGMRGGVYVGHSVSAMIGVLASLKAPGMFDSLVLVGPSPRYINDIGYHGGFTQADIDELLISLDNNHLGWSAAMAPAIMGNSDRPELSGELNASFCRTDPDVAKAFARVTFTADNRGDLARVEARTLIIQCRDDIIACEQVGEYVRDHIPGSQLVLLDASGHCPNLSAPTEVISAMCSFLQAA